MSHLTGAERPAITVEVGVTRVVDLDAVDLAGQSARRALAGDPDECREGR